MRLHACTKCCWNFLTYIKTQRDDTVQICVMERKMSMRQRKRRRWLQILVRLSVLELASCGWMGNYRNSNNTEWTNTEIISAPKDLMWGSLTEACWSATEEMTKWCSYFMATQYNIKQYALQFFFAKVLNSAVLIVSCKIPEQESSLYHFFKGVI